MKKLILTSVFLVGISLSFAQNPNYTMKIEPALITLEVGETIKISAKIFDKQGKQVLDRQVRFFSRKSKAVFVDSLNNVTASLPGWGIAFSATAF